MKMIGAGNSLSVAATPVASCVLPSLVCTASTVQAKYADDKREFRKQRSRTITDGAKCAEHVMN